MTFNAIARVITEDDAEGEQGRQDLSRHACRESRCAAGRCAVAAAAGTGNSHHLSFARNLVSWFRFAIFRCCWPRRPSRADALDDSFRYAPKAAIIVLASGRFVSAGQVLAKWLRMPDYDTKIGLVLATLFAGIADRHSAAGRPSWAST